MLNLLSKAVATTVLLPNCGLCEMRGEVVKRVSVPLWKDEVREANKLVSPNDEALEAER
jgi:hypothetical protein